MVLKENQRGTALVPMEADVLRSCQKDSLPKPVSFPDCWKEGMLVRFSLLAVGVQSLRYVNVQMHDLLFSRQGRRKRFNKITLGTPASGSDIPNPAHQAPLKGGQVPHFFQGLFRNPPKGPGF